MTAPAILPADLLWPTGKQTVTVSFVTSAWNEYLVPGMTPFTSQERAAAVTNAIDYVAGLSGLSVQLLPDGVAADIQIGWATLDAQKLAVTYINETTREAEVWMDLSDRGGLQMGPDLKGMRLLIHELGHALFRLTDVPGQATQPITHMDYEWLDSTKFTLIDRKVITDKWGAPPPGPAWFDAEYYLAKYADVRAAVATGGITAEGHWSLYGWAEGRDPSAWFDASEYLDDNPDVAAAHINPLTHYLTYGQFEARPAVVAAGWDGVF